MHRDRFRFGRAMRYEHFEEIEAKALEDQRTQGRFARFVDIRRTASAFSLIRREELVDRSAQDANRFPHLLSRRAVWGHDHDDIPYRPRQDA